MLSVSCMWILHPQLFSSVGIKLLDKLLMPDYKVFGDLVTFRLLVCSDNSILSSQISYSIMNKELKWPF